MSSPSHEILDTFDDAKPQALAELLFIAALAEASCRQRNGIIS